MIAERRGQAVGFVYCSVGEYHIGSDVLLTTIHNMNVARSVRSSLSGGKIALGLFRGVETWSQARGAKEIPIIHKKKPARDNLCIDGM
jgi:hypothetical protein